MTEDEALLDVCKEGLIWREVHDKPEYIDRLKTELKVIKEKNFSKYFLTMKAIMDIAREHMLIGPGRGSAAGSLVAWILGITNIDPIEHGLLFARFLSIHRTGAPDIDSDIADRDQLIGLLRKEFGDTNVIPISNYNTFKLKSLVKDISRFYGIEFDEVNRALGPVERDVKNKILKPGQDKNMFVLLYEDAYEHSKSFRDFIDKYPHVAEPIQILFKQNRSLGRHAGGLIISDRVGERMPLIKARGELQTPWVEGMNYKHLESLGWIKFDLLGLETLRIIHRCIELILQKHQGIERPTFKQVRSWFDEHLDPKKMDLNDPAVYEKVYQGGDFAGVFQLMSKGARRLFMQAKPDKLIDIATLTSVFRPGPLAANVHNLYIKAKRDPDAIDYGHPLIKQVLEPTYNCLIGDTKIMTSEGEVTIQEIHDRDMVGLELPSYNEGTGEIEADVIEAVVRNGEKPVLTIELEDGESLTLTDDHRVYTTRGWIPAGELTLTDEILGIE
jgi:DNA polymerase-3 subunit alpha